MDPSLKTNIYIDINDNTCPSVLFDEHSLRFSHSLIYDSEHQYEKEKKLSDVIIYLIDVRSINWIKGWAMVLPWGRFLPLIGTVWHHYYFDKRMVLYLFELGLSQWPSHGLVYHQWITLLWHYFNNTYVKLLMQNFVCLCFIASKTIF